MKHLSVDLPTLQTMRGSQPDPADPVRSVCRWAGIDLSDEAHAMLEAYARWLMVEATTAGGLGPAEGGRVWERHIADSLAFVAGFPPEPSGRLADLGSGVGLPGIPIAVVFPALAVVLVDRSGRRADLAQRAVRVVGLENVEIRRADADVLEPGWDLVTARAFRPPTEALAVIRRLLRTGGTGVIGLSRAAPPDVAAIDGLGEGAQVIPIPTDVLDSPGWLLTIRS